MLGYIAAGRLVNTDPEQIDLGKFVFTIPEPQLINHLVVFLTGEVAIEEGFGASIFLAWPSPDGGEAGWQYLGYITNDKPSAIFRISGTKPQELVHNPFGGMGMMGDNMANLAICVEPLEEMAHAMAESQAAAPTASDFMQFASVTVENLFNFVTSFAAPREQALRDADNDWFPLGALQRWQEIFLSKLQRDPTFWKR